MLMVAAMIDLKKNLLNKLIKSIIEYLKNRETDGLDDALEFLIVRQKKKISKENYQNLIKVKFRESSRSYPWVIIQITYSMQELKITFNSTFGKSMLAKLTRNIEHENVQLIACETYKLYSSPHQKSECAELINSSLQIKFIPKVFYISSLYEMLPYDEERMKIYAETCIPKRSVKLGALRSYKEGFGSDEVSVEDKRFNRVDEFINLIFKLKVEFEGEYKSRIQRLNLYYKWIVGIDDFDYRKFDPEWITEYGTRFYFRAFYESEKVKLALETFIASEDSHKSQKVMNDYLNIYLRKTWNKLD
jgi:hypothetical protein